jgi:hypothetical protein
LAINNITFASRKQVHHAILLSIFNVAYLFCSSVLQTSTFSVTPSLHFALPSFFHQDNIDLHHRHQHELLRIAGIYYYHGQRSSSRQHLYSVLHHSHQLSLHHHFPISANYLCIHSPLLKTDPQSKIKSTIWEDNAACLTLASSDPPRMTPRSKSIAVKYHWFREHLIPGLIEIHAIGTLDQAADIFTKAISQATFERLRFMLLGC